MEKSRSIGSTRPFDPPVHALILPSKIPSDLKPYFRYLDEDEIVRSFPLLPPALLIALTSLRCFVSRIRTEDSLPPT